MTIELDNGDKTSALVEFAGAVAHELIGWGLPRCAGFVRQSGGHIGLSSAPGKGTVIEILLPLDDAA